MVHGIWAAQRADKDLLGIKHEAEALAESLLLRAVLPPLAIGRWRIRSRSVRGFKTWSGLLNAFILCNAPLV